MTARKAKPASKAPTIAQRRKAVAEAVARIAATNAKGADRMARIATAEVVESIAQHAEALITPGMAADDAATLASIEVSASKRLHEATGLAWGEVHNMNAYDRKVHEAKAPGGGRAVGGRADEVSMLAHIERWVTEVGPRAASKASRDYQRLNPGRGCWPVYRRLFGEYVADPVQVMAGRAMTTKAVPYGADAEGGFGTRLAAYVAEQAAGGDEVAQAAAALIAARKAPAEVAEVAEPAPAKAPAKAPTKRTTRKATASKAS